MILRCHEAEEARLRAASGPLEAALEAALAEHLAACERCRRFAGEIDGLEGRLADAIGAVETGADPEAIEARASRREVARQRRASILVLAAAAVVLLAGVVLELRDYAHSPEGPIAGGERGEVVKLDPFTEVRLAPHAHANVKVLDRFGRSFDLAVVLESGRVHCRVEPGHGEFLVQTKYGEVYVTGTEFTVEVHEMRSAIIGGATGAVVVGVIAGVVILRNPAGDEREVKAGQVGVADSSGRIEVGDLAALRAKAARADALEKELAETKKRVDDLERTSESGKRRESELQAKVERLQASAASPSATPAPTPAPAPSPGPTPSPAKPAVSSDEAIRKFREVAGRGILGFQALASSDLVKMFKELGPDGIAILADALSDPSADVRFTAAAMLELLEDPAAVRHLDGALGDPDKLVRRMASHALAALGDEAAAAALERGTHDADWGVQTNSAYGLAKLGRPEGVRALREIYDNPETDAASRQAVLGGMADVGAPEYGSVFRPILADPKQELSPRILAIIWAGEAKDPESVALLEAMIASPTEDDSMKEMARKSLAKIRGEKTDRD